MRVQVLKRGKTTIRTTPLEEYVRGTVLAEFTSGGDEPDVVRRMLELQAIASRTYAVAHRTRHRREEFDLCSTVHCQVFDPERLVGSRWRDLATRAVRRTEGQILWHDDRPARIVFHADCGGHTASASEIWGGPGLPYLIGRPDLAGPHLGWRVAVRANDLLSALNADPLTDVGQRLGSVEVITRDPSGRAGQVALRGGRIRIVSGEDFRRIVTRALGASSIRSTLFDVRRDDDVITFAGRGFGHGVGLCQAGALARLRQGASIEAVLAHYFPGTELGTLPGARQSTRQ